MFERRPLWGVLILLTFVLTVWQMSPRDVTVYRDATMASALRSYPPSALPPGSGFALPYERTTAERQYSPHPVLTPPFGGDGVGDNAIDRIGGAYRFPVAINTGRTGGTYLNITSPPWLVAAAVEAVAGLHQSSDRTSSTSEVVSSSSSSSVVTTAVSGTQSTASLTLVNPYEELLPNDDYTSLIDLRDFKFTINYDYCGSGSVDGRSSIGSTSSNSAGSSSSSSSGSSSISDRSISFASDTLDRSTLTPVSGSWSSRKRRSRGGISESLKRDGNALRRSRSPSRSAPLVLVLVHSAPANVEKRNTIRSTWGRPDSRARLIFLLGAVNSSDAQRAIEEESLTNDDIVQGSFVDAYRNMTYKHVMALKWYNYHCPDARYVLKVDDDVFINAPVLYEVLQLVAPQRNLLLCELKQKLSVKRTHRSKWFVSWREYPARYYPPHCPGYSILYSADVARGLYREAQRQPYFWIDDVHITGTVAHYANVTITPMDGLYLDGEQRNDLLNHKLNATGLVFFFTHPNLPMNEIRRLWQVVTEPKDSRR
uniref:Putative galactosyltransferase n=1 Tax=Anopheles darlingi TaxID=43151 RepID=A0A2M4DIT9_ANODA